MFPGPCVCACMRARMCVCVCVCVCHNEENMHDERQARHATQAILVSIAQPQKKKLIAKEEAGDHRPTTLAKKIETTART